MYVRIKNFARSIERVRICTDGLVVVMTDMSDAINDKTTAYK